MAPPSSSPLSPSALKSEKRPPSPVAPVKVRIDGSQASLFSRAACGCCLAAPQSSPPQRALASSSYVCRRHRCNRHHNRLALATLAR